MQDLKKRLRKQLLELRTQMSDAAQQEEDRIILSLLQVESSYQNAKTIFTYYSVSGEVDTRKVISMALSQGKEIYLPRCLGKGKMKALRYRNGDELVTGAHGIPEPLPEAEEIDPKKLDLVLVPCIGYRSDGIRLGYGGGYYDRFLPETSAVWILLGREALRCEKIPREEFDCPVHLLLTGAGREVISYQE